MMASTRARLAALLMLLVTGWLGCASGPAPRDHFYRLDIAAPAELPSPALPGVLEVDRLRVEAIAQGRRMLYRDASLPNVIGQYNYHFWADPPGLMLQDQLAQSLRAAGAAKVVVTPGIHVDSDFSLKGRLVRLERHTGSGAPRIAVEIEFSLLRAKGNELLLQKNYSEERAVAGDDIGRSITAYQDAVSTIFQQLVDDLPRL
jgi:ABC-type uncharacterized transport system auxiliary subunit